MHNDITQSANGSSSEPLVVAPGRGHLIRLKAVLHDGTRVSIWRGWSSSWAAIAYATEELGARYASARVLQPARAVA